MVCGPPDHQDLVSHLKMKICFAPLHVVEIAAPSAVALTNLLQQTVQVNQHFWQMRPFSHLFIRTNLPSPTYFKDQPPFSHLF